MTIKNLTVFLFAIIVTNSFAQSALNLGLKGGLNYSGFHKETSAGTTEFGLNAGIIAEFKFSDKFALQTEVLYNVKGGEVNGDGSNINDFGFNAELTYIDIPLLVKFYPIERLSIDIGPQIGFIQDSKGVVTDNEGNENTIELTDINKTDFALNAGFTVKLSDRALFQARYSYGMNEIFENERYKNSVISVSLGYYFYKVGFFR